MSLTPRGKSIQKMSSEQLALAIFDEIETKSSGEFSEPHVDRLREKLSG